MFHIPAELEFQTVFQIVGTFEAFSVWKGARFFKADSRADFGVEMDEKFDDDTFENMCDDLKTTENKWKAFLCIGMRLCKGTLSEARGKISRWCRSWWWKFARFVHRTLACILRSTPIVTIPALALSYILQLGCVKAQFVKGQYVFWFIAGKLACYLLCLVFATLLRRHVNVKVTVADNGKILSEETGTAQE